MKTPPLLLLVPGLIALGAAGCLGLKSKPDPTRYYVLASLPAAATPTPGTLSLGLRRVKLPAYLDKRSIAVRADHEIRYAQYDEWAEPLDRGIQRVLAANLSSLLGTPEIRLSSWEPDAAQFDLSVSLDRFEVSAAGQGVLAARWEVFRANEKQRAATGQQLFNRQQAGKAAGAPATVELMSELLGEFSQTLAQTVEKLAAR